MALLFFALDLRTLSPPLLAQLKQCLLELANLYALSAPTLNLKRRKFDSSLEDRIGLCYFQRSAASSSNELKVAYSPRGRSFNLHDFHYAVNRLPSDSYSPPFLESSRSFVLHDGDISSIFNDEELCSAGGKELEKKIILISACLVGNMDSNAKKTLLDAADRCISVEFVFLEQKSSQLSDISENINKFRGQISDLENCSFNAYLPDGQVLNGLAKRWLRELKENSEELMAHFLFQRSIAGSINRICCRLCKSINQIMDGYSLCETHGYHDIRRDDRDGYMFKERLLNQVKKHKEPNDTDHNSTSTGENASLTEVSGRCWKNLREVSSAVIFNIIERTSLASLSEGVVIGRPYFVIPSVVSETYTAPEESDMYQLNNKFFQGLCRALYSMNQGLICWSYCNLEIMRETAFVYHYILQPSDTALMLLRRLAGAEEILPFPDANINDTSITEETGCCIQQCLLDVELRDYNPVLHCGGFHQKLNQLIEESLQPGLVDPETSTTPSTSTSPDDVAVSSQPCLVGNVAALPVNDVVPSVRNQADEHDKGSTRLTQEWEQLIVGGITRVDSVLSEPNLEKARTSPPASQRPLDTRTSKILERLGNPKQMKTKASTPMIMNSLATNPNETMGNLSAGINADQASSSSSSLMKPTFQRLKRKQR